MATEACTKGRDQTKSGLTHKRRYRCRPIALGANTDPYQPAARAQHITCAVLEVLTACRHPFTLTTTGALVERCLLYTSRCV